MRITDNSTHDVANANFVMRNRSHWIWQVIIGFIVALAAIFMVGIVIPTSRPIITISIILIIVSILAFYNIYLKQNNVDQIVATEFLNSLLSSALGAGSKFCLIAKLDGTLVYANKGLQELFPQFTNFSTIMLENILDAGKVAQKDRQNIHEAIIKKESVRLIFPIYSVDGTYKKYMMYISPLEKMQDYFVIRAREFIESRQNTTATPNHAIVHENSVLAETVRNAPAYHYVVNASGQVIAVSYNLEKILGYQEGQLNHEPFDLDTFLNITQEADALLANIDGTATLTRHNSSHLDIHLLQRVVIDAEGNTLGYYGIVVDYGKRLA